MSQPVLFDKPKAIRLFAGILANHQLKPGNRCIQRRVCTCGFVTYSTNQQHEHQANMILTALGKVDGNA